MLNSRVSIAADLCPVTVSAASQAEAAEWDRYVSSHRDASQYHQWRWRGVFERAFGHETQYLVARRGAGIAGVLPTVLFRSPLFGRFMVSLPFVNYGGVVADDDAAAEALLADAARIASAARLSHVELRHTSRQFESLPCKQHKVSMMLTLETSKERAWDSLDRKVRNQIRKAEKSGLSASAGGAELLDDFYAIFARNMRDLGTPVYARAFFDEVFAAFPDRARVIVVRQGATPVASGIVLGNGDSVEVPWASSLSEYRSLCPNHSLYWFVMQWAIEHRFRVLDFGRSTPDEGTFQFKSQWGAVPGPLCWEYQLLKDARMPDQSPKNPKYRAAIDLWKRCPLWLTNTIGPHIVRSIP
jgi:serine/alanine adding enzyme